MLPIMFLAMAGIVGEPSSARIAAIDQKARMYPPKRSPWYGTAEAAMKVTLWNGNGAGQPQKMKVDANLGGGHARDLYWFEAGQVSYGTQSRWSGGEAIERRMRFTAGKLTAVEERRASSDRALDRATFHGVAPEEVAKLRASVTSLLQECLKAPGLRDRKAMLKAVESDRVILETAPGVQAWISRRAGDSIAPGLLGRQVTYDFTAVDQDGTEQDYLNGLRPAGKAAGTAAAPAKVTLASAVPAAAAAPSEAAAGSAVVAPATTVVKKKPVARKGTRKKSRAKKAAPAPK